jgi:uncharacterized protein (DUF302 family)
MTTQVIGEYAIRVTTKLPFEAAIERVTALLADEGFGVLTEIDVAATLKKKLGIDTRPYRILGACNPQFAHAALEATPYVGVFLPCNVVVWDEGDQRVVAAMEARAMGQIIGLPDVRKVSNDVSDRMRRVLEKLPG